MTSAITPGTIVTNYPIAGQDNDSQGFRNNFAAIAGNFATAATEITELQTVAIVSADLATQTTPVVNNLLGSTLSNGIYSQFDGVFFNGGTISSISTATPVSHTNGPIQKFTIGVNNVVLNLGYNGTTSTWPAAGRYSVIRLMLVNGDTSTVKTVTLSIPGGGTAKTSTGWTGGTGPVTLTVPTSQKYEVIEFWTVDSGSNVFIKNVGEF
jgi:hypothetical protein